MGFVLWSPETRNAERSVIECFPAEAIWSVKRQSCYDPQLTAACVKAYKKQKGRCLTGLQVQELMPNALGAFAAPSGDARHWATMLEAGMVWMLEDQTWCLKDGYYRGGKLLDDVVDTLICLATSLSWARGRAHVWQDPTRPDDGHIIGPGCPPGGLWVTA
jgi:hypothetical protein